MPEHKTSFKRPLSADLAARGRTRTLQKLHRICLAEVRTLKARYTLATVKLALSKYRERDPRPCCGRERRGGSATATGKTTSNQTLVQHSELLTSFQIFSDQVGLPLI